MSPTRSAAGLAVAASLALVAGGLAAPVAAADSPEDAVNQLLDASVTGDYEAIDALVCEAERGAVRSMLDPSEAMDMELARELLTFDIEDRSVEVLSEDDQEATVRFTGTMSMSVGDGDVEAVAMALLEEDMGELSEEDIELMLPFLEMALTQSMPVDEELTVVVEDGQWVVCGGLGEPVEDDFGFEPTVSSEGACALATPEELTALGPLEYDSSNGFETFCSYSNSDFEVYHSASVTVQLDEDAEYYAGFYGADEPLEVAGAPAWATSDDEANPNLVVQAGPDIIQVSVFSPEVPPEGYDWLSQASAIVELVLPRLADLRVELAGPTPEPRPEPTPEVPLCESGFIDELNAATGLGLDTEDIGAGSCSYSPLDTDPGFHVVYAYTGETPIDDYRLWLPDPEETTVAGQRALLSDTQVIIELPDASGELGITVSLDTGDEGLSVSVLEVAEIVAQHIFENLPANE